MWSCCCVKAACWSDAPLPRTDINSPMIKARADVVSSARAFSFAKEEYAKPSLTLLPSWA